MKECRELEEVLGTSFTDEILMGGEMVGMKEVKKIVKEVDRKLLLSRCRGKAPMIASVGEDGGWLRLGHVNKISCFSSFCLQKFGEGGGYLLFIFRGQRSYATIFTGVKLGYKRRVKGRTGTTQVKKE